MLEQEIQEILKKNLPAQVGEVLKQRLEQAEKDAAMVKSKTGMVDSLLGQINKLEEKIQEYSVFDERNSTLDNRLSMIEAAERIIRIKELEYQLAAERDKTQFSKDVALGLVRNSEYRKNIFDSEAQAPYQDANGTWYYPQPVCKSFTETKETN